MSVHDRTYDTVCELLDKIATPLRQYMDGFSQDELSQPLKYPQRYPIEYPYCKFSCPIGDTTFTFESACNWWETFYGAKESDRFAEIMCWELREMVAGRGEYVAHVEATLAQQEYVAEGETAA